MDPRSRTAMNAKDLAIADGIDKRFAGVASITLNGVKYEPAKLAQMFRDHVERQRAADLAYGEYRKQVQEVRRGNLTLAPLRRNLRSHVIVNHGEDPRVLGAFGFEPTKRGKKSTEVKKKAAEKAKATRAVRNTLGKRQKAKIKGTVPDKGGKGGSK